MFATLPPSPGPGEHWWPGRDGTLCQRERRWGPAPALPPQSPSALQPRSPSTCAMQPCALLMPCAQVLCQIALPSSLQDPVLGHATVQVQDNMLPDSYRRLSCPILACLAAGPCLELVTRHRPESGLLHVAQQSIGTSAQHMARLLNALSESLWHSDGHVCTQDCAIHADGYCYSEAGAAHPPKPISYMASSRPLATLHMSRAHDPRHLPKRTCMAEIVTAARSAVTVAHCLQGWASLPC